MSTVQRLSLSELVVLKLVATQGIGHITFHKIRRWLEERQKNFVWWYRQPSLWLETGLTQKQAVALSQLEETKTWQGMRQKLENNAFQVLTMLHRDYPEQLLQLDQSPPILFYRGDVALLRQSLMVAVVGTRKMTSYGRLVTERIVAELAQASACIVSGAMVGVDQMAHLTALEHQAPTIGVLGFGFDHIYPKNSRQFFKHILNNDGLLVTEHPPWVGPQAGNFVQRNRIIAGLAAVVVVTEAAKRSGSHLTVGFALDLGKEIAAVPGPITSVYSEGTKWLLNQGATLVSSGNEVLQLLGHDAVFSTLVSPSHSPENKLVREIAAGASTLDQLSQAVPLSFSELLVELTKLQLAGTIIRQHDRWYMGSFLKKTAITSK